MTDIELIDKLLKAKKPTDIFTSDDWKKEYTRYAMLIHPDKCRDPRAGDAMAVLSGFKDLITRGSDGTDDSGYYKRFENKMIFEVTDDNEKLFQRSAENWRRLRANAVGNKDNFKKYQPDMMSFKGKEFIVEFNERALPLAGITLPQVHVNWIFSRMFEFSLFVRMAGYSHMGINPETIFIVPDTHGIICTSFYHLTPLGQRAKTYATRYRNWYPSTLFSKKKATGDIDLELAKKTAIYLLGDKSGAGTSLKRNSDVNQDMLTFFLSKHEGVFTDYDDYRSLLAKNFEKKFYKLDI